MKPAVAELLHNPLVWRGDGLARSGAWVALVAPPHLPCAPAFAGAGIDPARVAVVDAGEEKDRWWAAEQVLRADSAAVLLFWPQSISDARLRRLAVAAQDTAMLAFLFAVSARAASPSPAPLRIRLSPDGGGLRLDVFKRR